MVLAPHGKSSIGASSVNQLPAFNKCDGDVMPITNRLYREVTNIAEPGDQGRIVKKAIYFTTLILVAHAALGQSTSFWNEASKPTIRSTSTLVTVPTSVRSASGDPVANLEADQFRLTDNGIEQKISVEQDGNQPVAVVVLMQTGGAASKQLQNYSKLDTLLESMLGSSTRKIALVTFDSRPEQIWGFPPRNDALFYFLTHPKVGNYGAAVLDAVVCAIGLLEQEPPSFRRIILLLSQDQDDGSKAHAEDLLRALAASGTTVYSLTFSAPHSSDRLSDANRPAASVGAVLRAMRENTAAEVATLSGGAQVFFHDEQGLETRMATLATDVRNGYTLSFYPSSHESGLHTIKVEVTKKEARFEVTARTSYWFDERTTQ